MSLGVTKITGAKALLNGHSREQQATLPSYQTACSSIRLTIDLLQAGLSKVLKSERSELQCMRSRSDRTSDRKNTGLLECLDQTNEDHSYIKWPLPVMDPVLVFSRSVLSWASAGLIILLLTDNLASFILKYSSSSSRPQPQNLLESPFT